MRTLLLLAIICLASLAHAGEKKRVVLFATMLENTPVTLDDGARWMMDKGDTFPLLMFKEQQTQVVLQLAGTRFMIPASRVRVLDEKEATPEMLSSYRRNVDNYIESKAKKWREETKAQ
jgi:hypothetical protein